MRATGSRANEADSHTHTHTPMRNHHRPTCMHIQDRLGLYERTHQQKSLFAFTETGAGNHGKTEQGARNVAVPSSTNSQRT